MIWLPLEYKFVNDTFRFLFLLLSYCIPLILNLARKILCFNYNQTMVKLLLTFKPTIDFEFIKSNCLTDFYLWQSFINPIIKRVISNSKVLTCLFFVKKRTFDITII